MPIWQGDPTDIQTLMRMFRDFRWNGKIVPCDFCHASISALEAYLDMNPLKGVVSAYCDEDCYRGSELLETVQATEEARLLLGAPSLFAPQYPLPEKIGKSWVISPSPRSIPSD